MLSLLKDIPNINKHPLQYVFEDLKLEHKHNTVWLEFGVFSGKSINYISNFTSEKVYGFDSFEGLPDDWRPGFPKGTFHCGGYIPSVNSNVKLIKGWFNQTLEGFSKELETSDTKVSFIHMDADLYSSTKYQLDTNCIIVFDELLNYDGFDGETGELRAFYEFVTENDVKYTWIGMNGEAIGMRGYDHEVVAVKIHSIGI